MNKIIPSHINSQLQRRQGQIQRQQNQQSHVFTQSGKVLIVQNGTRSESTVEVPFTHVFTEEPHFDFGMSLDTNQAYTPGNAPTISGCVYNWIGESKGGLFIYTGAWIVFVTTGTDQQHYWAKYRFEGRGLSFPTAATPSNSTGNA